MKRFLRFFNYARASERPFSLGDAVILAAFAVLLYLGIRLAVAAPAEVMGPRVSLSPAVLPYYALLSTGRMVAAYALSMLFTFAYGYPAARSRRAERVMIPILDILQSVPILSFLPIVLLSLGAVLPVGAAAELSSIILIFTSQAWNLAFSWYQSLTTIPEELREASSVFRFNSWLRFKTLELPAGAVGLTWNSMMSWAGGWFFLMAAETFTVGERNFQLLGLGSYLKRASVEGDIAAILWGLFALIALIVVLDQLVLRPLLAWSDRFVLRMAEPGAPASSWFYDALKRSALVELLARAWSKLSDRLDEAIVRRWPPPADYAEKREAPGWIAYPLAIAGSVALVYGGYRAILFLAAVPALQWAGIAAGLGATFLRVLVVLVIALAWTVPVGFAIGANPKLTRVLQPAVQVAAAVPATALFPILVLLFLSLPGGLNAAAIVLMLLGTQWYVLFNVIAGASAIPRDLADSADILQLRGWDRWRFLILPSIFPYAITGAITAAGGAWNASIVAEYIQFGGKTLSTLGIGSAISEATAAGDFPMLFAATLVMIAVVVLINRLFWRRLYVLAEERYRIERS